MEMAPAAGMTSVGILVIGILGLAFIILAIVGIVFGVGHARHGRDAEHLERMKALECGLTLPGDAPWWSPNRVAAGIGVGVPIFSFAAAFLTTSLGHGPHEIAIWASTGAVAVAALICGSVLAVHLPRSAEPQSRPISMSKPEFDPDSFDTAGRRG